MMDEGIDLMRTLWAGGSSFHGQHYDYAVGRDDLAEVARPVQGRIPIWVVALWPRPKSLRRVLRCDGVIQGGEMTPEDIRSMRTWLEDRGAAPELDILAEGETPADDLAAGWAQVEPWAEAGCTWWMETRWDMPHHSQQRMREIRDRITAGPPRDPAGTPAELDGIAE
jgi:hypothetical protein